jgi:hypothetical protein
MMRMSLQNMNRVYIYIYIYKTQKRKKGKTMIQEELIEMTRKYILV